MLSYIEYLNLPAKVAIALVGLFLLLQIVGEVLELKGKVVPEFVKVRKYFKRKAVLSMSIVCWRIEEKQMD